MEHSKCDKPFQDLSFFRSDLSERAQHNWFNTFEFLHYDVSKNAVLLHVHSGCAAEDKEGEVDPAFVIDLFMDSKVQSNL